MFDDVDFWILAGFVVFGLAAAIWGYFRTPRGARDRSQMLAERLKACPPSAEAVIIKADRKRAWMTAAPQLVVSTLMVAFGMWIESRENLACVRLFDWNAAYLAFVLTFKVVPLWLLAVALHVSREGLKTIKTGYLPPLDTAVFQDAIAKKGPFRRACGVVFLLYPLLPAYAVYLGHDLHARTVGEGGVSEFVKAIETDCR